MTRAIGLGIILAIFVVGACLYRLRGSGWSRNKVISAMNKWWYAVAYGLAMGFDTVNLTRIDTVVSLSVRSVTFSIPSSLSCAWRP